MIPNQYLIPVDGGGAGGIESVPLEIVNRKTGAYVTTDGPPVVTHVFGPDRVDDGPGGVTVEQMAESDGAGGTTPLEGNYFINIDLTAFNVGDMLTVRGSVPVGGKSYGWTKSMLLTDTVPALDGTDYISVY